MMKRGFTLIELMVVVGIMGLLGTVSVGGYRAMQRGMEEKGVLQNVNALVRAAYQRAQVDRQPTAIFMWNETIRAESADENILVVGKAVAVRRSGRITKAQWPLLYDEFADLNHSYPPDAPNGNSANSTAATIYLYPMEGLQNSNQQILRSVVEGFVQEKTLTPTYFTDIAQKTLDSGNLTTYAFKGKDQGGVTWKTGMAYGFEFASIDLPHGYIFGDNYKRTLNDPVQPAGVRLFDVMKNNGTGMQQAGSFQTIQIYALRPDRQSGELKAESVGTTGDPSKDMK